MPVNKTYFPRCGNSLCIIVSQKWINKKLTKSERVLTQVAHALHRLINRCEKQSLEPQNSPGYICMNYIVMMQSFEKEKNRQAGLVTGGIALAMLLTFVFLKWPLPVIEVPPQDLYVEIDLGEPPITVKAGGGGGGGNIVKADKPAGIAKPAVVPGIKEDSKDFATNDKDDDAPPAIKPPNPKPEAKQATPNTAIVKTDPKPVETPAPPRPKAVAGKTLTGSGTGGGTADNYDIAGGTGTGTGVGTGAGYGGGTGGGSGGGNGTGTGSGNGPRRVSGNRSIVTTGKLDAGENISGKVEAEIKVSADGVGTLVRTVRGSLMSDSQAKDIIRDWLRRNRFNRTGEESVVVYEFNIRTGG